MTIIVYRTIKINIYFFSISLNSGANNKVCQSADFKPLESVAKVTLGQVSYGKPHFYYKQVAIPKLVG